MFGTNKNILLWKKKTPLSSAEEYYTMLLNLLPGIWSKKRDANIASLLQLKQYYFPIR